MQKWKVYLYPKPVDFRKSIDDLAALVEMDTVSDEQFTAFVAP